MRHRTNNFQSADIQESFAVKTLTCITIWINDDTINGRQSGSSIKQLSFTASTKVVVSSQHSAAVKSISLVTHTNHPIISVQALAVASSARPPNKSSSDLALNILWQSTAPIVRQSPVVSRESEARQAVRAWQWHVLNSRLKHFSSSWQTRQYFRINTLHTWGDKWRTGEHQPISGKDFEFTLTPPGFELTCL